MDRSDGSGRAAEGVALEPACNRQQADALPDHRARGIGQRVKDVGLARGGEQALRDLDAERLRRTAEVKQLTLPSEMGERFQAMGFSRDVEFGAAFLAGDLSHRL